MNRREFAQTCLTALPTCWSLHGQSNGFCSEVPPNIKIPKTDTHVHLFDLQNLSYGWLKNAPEINRDFSLADFKEASKKSKVGKILFMESGADPGLGVKEARWVARLAEDEPRIRGIVARLDLTSGKEATETLGKLEEIELLKGIRCGFPKQAASSPIFLENLKRLAHRNLTFDFLLTPPLLEEAAKVAGQCPRNTFVLDHFGNPDVKTGDIEIWKKGIAKLAGLPNVHCKLSGIITRAGKGWKINQLEPYIMHTIEQFGVDRLVYGGDWPVVLRAGSYLSWSKAFEKLTRSLQKPDLQKIYYQNADRIYNLS